MAATTASRSARGTASPPPRGRPGCRPAPTSSPPTWPNSPRSTTPAFRARFAGSPVKRIGRDRFVRNVLIAIGNSADPALAPVARARLGDADPVVADAAAWAVARLENDGKAARTSTHEPAGGGKS